MANDLGTSNGEDNGSKVIYCSPTNPVKDSCVPIKITNAVINLFFDGTKNNLYNTRDKQQFATNIHKNAEKYESYTNAFSNVAHLYMNRFLTGTNAVWVYVEGAGSALGKEVEKGKVETLKSSGEKDDTQGFAFGSGSTGVKERAKQAFSRIKYEFELQYGKGNRPDILTINLYGFSRGAATARHFIHVAKTCPELFKGWGLTASKIRFKFVGVFDTVSSFHPNYSLVPDFDNDVKELGLNFINLDATDIKITKVFHIIAMDEYRKYFSVTNIGSALSRKFGIEIFINGAHSDIGGSYNNYSSDSYDIELNNNTLKDWFIDKGYYRDDQLIVHKKLNMLSSDFYQFNRNLFNNQIDRNDKGGIKNDIHKITLKMMRGMAENYGKVNFNEKIENIEIPHPFITELMGSFPSQVFDFASEGKWGGSLNFLFDEDHPKIKKFRNHFVHCSAKYIKGTFIDDLGYSLRVDDNGIPFRALIQG